MRQVLFWIPLEDWFGVGMNVPIYGFGTMLFVAFAVCMWLAVRLGRRKGMRQNGSRTWRCGSFWSVWSGYSFRDFFFEF
jgi:hypothetical protein